MSRDPALLTPAQREYLRGEAEYEREQSETNTRYRMRKRIRNSLKDLELLSKELDPEDRKQVFADLHPLTDDDAESDDLPLREDEMSGVIGAITFLYAGSRDIGIPFEQLVEYGLLRALDQELEGPFTSGTATVTIETQSQVDPDAVVEKIAAERSLSAVEYEAIKRLLGSDLDRLLEAFEDINLPVVDEEEQSDTLSLGRSLVLMARLLDDPTYLDPEMARQLLAPRIGREFSLPSYSADT
ncbi:hypothetical protein DU504_12820 [Haloplanus salinus]|uniref:Domain of unknown function domain-containing protein n=1 Tax=Haloplanus salinus TaxID=1126245 RepID=A0A368NEL4_9EURY|nr:hypothetical protein [Haloplanus salinus]RCU48105.1 hypothetical protein DU504_12820 [Haloplanus salinus]